jgi:hypothetical protein
MTIAMLLRNTLTAAGLGVSNESGSRK